LFSKVKPGNPWWYWFDDSSIEEVVLKVVRDGSGGLWVDFKGHGVPLKEFEEHSPCLGPVAPRVSDYSKLVHLKKDPSTYLPMCECCMVSSDFLTTKFKEVTCSKCQVAIRKAHVD
jgi:hypothetical protein